MTYNIYNLKKIRLDGQRLSGPRLVQEKAKSEIEAQKQRIEGKFQTLYRNELVIPTDPSEP